MYTKGNDDDEDKGIGSTPQFLKSLYSSMIPFFKGFYSNVWCLPSVTKKNVDFNQGIPPKMKRTFFY